MLSTLSHFFATLLSFIVALVMSVAHIFVPLPPTCLLSVHTPTATTETSTTTGAIAVTDGENVYITWSSVGADTATVNGVVASSTSGTDMYEPHSTTTYTYVFFHRGTQARCSVTVGVSPKQVVIVTPVASVTPQPKPTPTPKPAPVTPPVPLPPTPVPPVVTPPNNPPNKPPTVPIGPTTIVVGNIPLLSGGQVHGSQTVPVSYLQITNVGKASTIVSGFWVTQTGTTPPSSVIGLSTVDDHGGSRGSVGGSEGASPFSSYTALAPSDAYFEPGQLRLFTIKAKITGDTGSIVGTTVSLVVSKVETAATVEGTFPIKGTTYIITK